MKIDKLFMSFHSASMILVITKLHTGKANKKIFEMFNK